MIHVVDTHALTRYVENYSRLGAAGRAIFEDPTSVLLLPTIALAEARFMIFKNKVNILWRDIMDLMDNDGRFVPVDLTLDILDRMPDNLEMHDGIIVATATMLGEVSNEGVRVITRDKGIRDSGLVETVW
ncbi:MAG TPA: hypothetical protein VGR43_08340 [Dehalococcoidia bacterium]|jgi:hypothetical protein|nr:hypothetical protein [Dehalococcoidia bacterium]